MRELVSDQSVNAQRRQQGADGRASLRIDNRTASWCRNIGLANANDFLSLDMDGGRLDLPQYPGGSVKNKPHSRSGLGHFLAFLGSEESPATLRPGGQSIGLPDPRGRRQ